MSPANASVPNRAPSVIPEVTSRDQVCRPKGEHTLNGSKLSGWRSRARLGSAMALQRRSAPMCYAQPPSMPQPSAVFASLWIFPLEAAGRETGWLNFSSSACHDRSACEAVAGVSFSLRLTFSSMRSMASPSTWTFTSDCSAWADQEDDASAMALPSAQGVWPNEPLFSLHRSLPSPPVVVAAQQANKLRRH